MRKKVKNSLIIKVFLWVFLALTVCSTLIYEMVLTFLPKQYQVTSDEQLEVNTENLALRLRELKYEDAVNEIYNFCIQNNSAAMLSNDDGVLNFGEIKTENLMVATESIATMVTFLDSKTEYTLVVSSLSQTSDIIRKLMLRFLPVVLVIILLLSALSAFICSKVIVDPIAKISQIAKRMTSLDMTWECKVESGDEIGVLASSLNTMANRLHETMEELTNANNQLSDDVEKFRALEEQRRNFFAAVSHELKTPLTILKGQIENMILGYGDYQDHEKYLPEALKATEDIENLVKEIITISKMESMDIEDTLRSISLKQTVNDVVETILPLAQDKNIQIYQNINNDEILFVNPNLWSKALSNIIGNAVRYSPCGENIFITLQSSGKAKLVVIENTGVFIPETDCSHLFTPFYRADKSRNKATGGSGLGLYIVKTIFDLHGINYHIRNTERGVAFSICLNADRKRSSLHS